MSIDLKDACKKCPKYKTCTEPCFFASAIADDILDISMKKYHAQMRDYTGLKDGKVLDFCGRETPLSGMLHSVDTLEFLESIESDEPSPEDILAGDIDTEDLPSGASVFLDVLKHGRDYKRVADNHGTTYDNVKSMHLKITKSLQNILELQSKYHTPLHNLAEYDMPIDMKAYIASRLFDGMSMDVICEALGIPKNSFMTYRRMIEEQIQAGNVVFYMDNGKLIPNTVSRYLKYLSTLPDYIKPVKKLASDRRKEVGKRVSEALTLVRGGMSHTAAAKQVGVAPSTVRAALHTA